MTQPTTTLSWVRPRRSSRQSAIDSICDLAEQLLDEGSWDQTSLEEIGRRAGVSPLAVRARVPEKDTILHLLHERYMTEAAATSDAILAPERWEGCSIPEIIREVIPFLIGIYRERQSLIRALLVAAASNEELRERSRGLQRQVGESLRKLILARRKELLHPAPAIAAEFSSRLTHGLLMEKVLNGTSTERDSIKLSDEQVTTELIHAVLAYLGVFSTDDWDC